MAEFCKKCFIEEWRPSQEDIDNIVLTKENEFCEGCMKLGPVVLHTMGDGYTPNIARYGRETCHDTGGKVHGFSISHT